ncbi:MAG: serine protease [Chitinophagaceae bacterium]
MLRVTLILLISHFGTKVFSQDAKLIYKNVANSTVTIETDKGLGSGFFVGKNIIATNYHVIEGSKVAYCYTNNSDTKYNIEGFLAIDTSTDLILLKVASLNRTPLKMASKSVVAGQKIFVIGSPKGLPATISDGLVSGLRNFGGHKYIQITAPISQGSSGGPVLNVNGELVGVSTGQIIGGQNLNFAIPKSNVELLLKTKKNNPLPLSRLPVIGQSINQTKTETQDWIKEKIESFTHTFNNPPTGRYGTKKYEVEYNECNIIVKYKNNDTWTTLDNKQKSGFLYITYKIPVNLLSRVNFIKDDEIYQMIFKIKSSDLLITETIESDMDNVPKIKQLNTAILYIPNNLLEGNLPDRLIKAFDKLIELCGGKVTKDIF